MKLKRMDHIGINCGNFSESLKFYRDILGLYFCFLGNKTD